MQKFVDQYIGQFEEGHLYMIPFRFAAIDKSSDTSIIVYPDDPILKQYYWHIAAPFVIEKTDNMNGHKLFVLDGKICGCENVKPDSVLRAYEEESFYTSEFTNVFSREDKQYIAIAEWGAKRHISARVVCGGKMCDINNKRVKVSIKLDLDCKDKVTYLVYKRQTDSLRVYIGLTCDHRRKPDYTLESKHLSTLRRCLKRIAMKKPDYSMRANPYNPFVDECYTSEYYSNCIKAFLERYHDMQESAIQL
jgi:hypothetical protein